MKHELLVIDRKNTFLEATSGRLVVRIAQNKPVSLPLAPLERIIITTPVEMSSQLLNHLSTHQVAIVFLTHHYKLKSCWLHSNHHGDHQRRLKQFELCQSVQNALQLAKRIVRTKLLNQKRNLIRWQAKFPAARLKLQLAINTINNSLQRVAHTTQNNELMGLEGAAASAYFQAISAMLADSYGFKGRNKRPPKDPINACLSLSYTLAQQEAETIVLGYGLDPGLGFLHTPSYSRASLGCDLVELLRAKIDFWTIELFTSRTLTVEHFYFQDEACLLGKKGREHFFSAWALKRQNIKCYLHKILRLALKEY